MAEQSSPVRYRLRTADHSRGYLLEAGTIIGDDTPYPLIKDDPSRDMIPLTPTAQAIFAEKDERKGWSKGSV